jgi:tetratricopeptide (TPR) repeat protein
MTVDTLGLPLVDRPYAGTRAYGPGDAHQFFGRATEAVDVAETWRSRRVTVLTGPSGSGLTSLLAAGVLPRLARDGADVLPVARITSDASGRVVPLLAPAGRNPFVSALVHAWSRPGARAEPPEASGGLITELFHRRAGSGDRVLAAVDQVEGIFADPVLRGRHLDGLIAELSTALREHPRLHLLLVVRDAHWSALRPYAERLSPDEPATVRLRPLTLPAALEAVRRPLENTDREFAPGAAEHLLEELVSVSDGQHGDRIAPTLLQVCCARIWSRVPADVRSIAAEHIDVYASVDRSLTDFVAGVLSETAAEHRRGVDELRSWLQRARLAGGLSGAQADESVLRVLENRRLLRSEEGPDGIRYVLQHPRLAAPIGRVPSTFTAGDYLRSAELALAAGELDLAGKHVTEALTSAPADDRRLRADAERLQGDIAAERGRSEAAEDHYLSAAALLEALQDTEAVGLLLAAIGRLQLARGLGGPAFDKLRAAADRLPGDPHVNVSLARALWSMGQRQAAVSVLTGLLSANENVPDALRTRGEFLADLGEAQRALRDLDRVGRNLRPLARAARALALATLADWEHSRDEVNTALAEAPENGQVLLYAARVAELGGDPETAAERAGRALEVTEPPLSGHQRDEAFRLLDRIRAR